MNSHQIIRMTSAATLGLLYHIWPLPAIAGESLPSASSRIEWKIEAAREVDSIISVTSQRGDTQRLTPSEGHKVVIVDVTWRLRAGSDTSGEFKLDLLDFTAIGGGEAGVGAAAISPAKADATGIWFIPERGRGKTFGFDLKKWSEQTISVGFVVPKSWESFEVRFAQPIGSTKIQKSK